MAVGVCRLTGAKGKLVRCHLLPKAVTRPRQRGNYFITGGPYQIPGRRFTSWYDEGLVTEEGERILRDYDTAGIRELRRLRLVWSGWDGTDAYHGVDMFPSDPTVTAGHGMRGITHLDGQSLRLFFLSLLWRAAATDRTEFAEVQLPADHMDTLTNCLLRRCCGPLDFYPVSLVQLTTRSIAHNLAPLALDNTIDIGGGLTHRLYVFRFYLDGLIAYFNRSSLGADISGYAGICVGHGPTLAVLTRPVEGSFQMMNLLQGREEAYLQWPKTMTRLGDLMDAPNYQTRLARYDAMFGPNHPWLHRRES